MCFQWWILFLCLDLFPQLSCFQALQLGLYLLKTSLSRLSCAHAFLTLGKHQGVMSWDRLFLLCLWSLQYKYPFSGKHPNGAHPAWMALFLTILTFSLSFKLQGPTTIFSSPGSQLAGIISLRLSTEYFPPFVIHSHSLPWTLVSVGLGHC